ERLFAVDMFPRFNGPQTHRDVALRSSEVKDKPNRLVLQKRIERCCRDSKFAGSSFGSRRIEIGTANDPDLREGLGRSQIGGADIARTDNTYAQGGHIWRATRRASPRLSIFQRRRRSAALHIKFGLSYIRVFLKESWMALVAFSGVVALEAIAT